MRRTRRGRPAVVAHGQRHVRPGPAQQREPAPGEGGGQVVRGGLVVVHQRVEQRLRRRVGGGESALVPLEGLAGARVLQQPHGQLVAHRLVEGGGGLAALLLRPLAPSAPRPLCVPRQAGRGHAGLRAWAPRPTTCFLHGIP